MRKRPAAKLCPLLFHRLFSRNIFFEKNIFHKKRRFSNSFRRSDAEFFTKMPPNRNRRKELDAIVASKNGPCLFGDLPSGPRSSKRTGRDRGLKNVLFRPPAGSILQKTFLILFRDLPSEPQSSKRTGRDRGFTKRSNSFRRSAFRTAIVEKNWTRSWLQKTIQFFSVICLPNRNRRKDLDAIVASKNVPILFRELPSGPQSSKRSGCDKILLFSVSQLAPARPGADFN